MNYRMIRNILGWILIFDAIFMVVPTITAIVYGEREVWHFLTTMGICLFLGFLMSFHKPKNTTLYAREGFIIVSLSWIVLSVMGAIPLWISGSIPSFVDALFETVSGFTTTGASIVPAVEELPKCMLMWRSFTHWVGGMGVLVFIMAFVPLSGGQNMHIMKAESPGPSVSKLVPRVRTTAMILYSIYIALTLIMLISLLIAGMSPFEALNTSFGTAGTGGFGIYNDSFLSFSTHQQVIVTVFMLLFSVNFSCYYLFLLGRFREGFNTELRHFIFIVTAAITIVTLNIMDRFESVWEALNHASFTVASIVSTTGFATVDFDLWPSLSKAILVLLMFIGACAGSTGGGIKVSRIVIALRGITLELGNAIFPHRVRKVTVDKRSVEPETLHSVNVYLVCYAVVFAGSVLFLTVDGHDLITNFTAVAATINNIGPGLADVGPTQNFAFFSVPSKLVLIFDMLAGRLELLPMLALFHPGTWKK